MVVVICQLLIWMFAEQLFVGDRTEFAMSTLQPSKRMNRQARRAMTMRHDNVLKMAVDGVHTLSVSRITTVLTACVN